MGCNCGGSTPRSEPEIGESRPRGRAVSRRTDPPRRRGGPGEPGYTWNGPPPRAPRAVAEATVELPEAPSARRRGGVREVAGWNGPPRPEAEATPEETKETTAAAEEREPSAARAVEEQTTTGDLAEPVDGEGPFFGSGLRRRLEPR